MSIENLKSFDPFADEGAADTDPVVPLAKTADFGPAIDPIPYEIPEDADPVDVPLAKTADLGLEFDEADVGSLDPFPYEDPLAETADVGSTLDHIHIRIQQRNGRKTLTTLQGLPKKRYKEKKLLQAFKKEFACNGTLIDDEKTGRVIQLQGDQRNKITDFLVREGLPKNTIMVHGF